MKWSPSCLQKDKGGFFIYTDFVQCILKKEWWAMYQVKNFTDSKDVKKDSIARRIFHDRISARFKPFSRFGYDRLFLQPDECTETSAGMRNEPTHRSPYKPEPCSGCSATSTPQPVLKRRRRSFWQGYPRQSYRGIRYQTWIYRFRHAGFRAYLQAPDFNGCCRLGWISRVRRRAFSGLWLQFEA